MYFYCLLVVGSVVKLFLEVVVSKPSSDCLLFVALSSSTFKRSFDMRESAAASSVAESFLPIPSSSILPTGVQRYSKKFSNKPVSQSASFRGFTALAGSGAATDNPPRAKAARRFRRVTDVPETVPQTPECIAGESFLDGTGWGRVVSLPLRPRSNMHHSTCNASQQNHSR